MLKKITNWAKSLNVLHSTLLALGGIITLCYKIIHHTLLSISQTTKLSLLNYGVVMTQIALVLLLLVFFLLFKTYHNSQKNKNSMPSPSSPVRSRTIIYQDDCLKWDENLTPLCNYHESEISLAMKNNQAGYFCNHCYDFRPLKISVNGLLENCDFETLKHNAELSKKIINELTLNNPLTKAR